MVMFASSGALAALLMLYCPAAAWLCMLPIIAPAQPLCCLPCVCDSPLPPPREPKAGTERMPYRDDRPPPPGRRRGRSPSPRARDEYKRHRRDDNYYDRQ